MWSVIQGLRCVQMALRKVCFAASFNTDVKASSMLAVLERCGSGGCAVVPTRCADSLPLFARTSAGSPAGVAFVSLHPVEKDFHGLILRSGFD